MSAIQKAVDVVGSQIELARRIGVTQSLISQWVQGATILPKHFLAIERATRGTVNVQALLEDELVKSVRRTG
jgi:DNA-binding transcriptional regulator YdaS (Cro superfamily)